MNLTIKSKLILLASIALLLIGGISIVETLVTKDIVLTTESENVGVAVRQTLKDSLEAQIDTVTLSTELFYKQAQQDNIKKELAAEIDVIYQTITSIYENTESKSEAKASIHSFLNNYKWGNNRYVFSYDKDSIDYVTHTLKPSLIGTPAKNAQDKNGVYYARNIVNVALESKVGYTKYAFMNPNTNRIEDKLTVAMLFAPLNIVIATGEYISSLQAVKKANALAMITHAKFGKNGYFWIQDRQGVILAHPKQSLVGTAISNTKKIAKQVSTKEDAFVPITFNNPATHQTENKISYARNIFPDWGWTIVTGAYESDITKAQEKLTHATQDIFNSQTVQNIVLLLTATVITIGLFIYFINRITHRLSLLQERVASLSSGEADLRSRLEMNGKDEINEIADAVNDFIVYLQKMLRELSASSHHITNNINGLSAQSEQNHIALNNHANETEQVVTAITEMSATANSVADSANQSAESTSQAEKEANDAHQLVVSTTASVNKLQSEIEQAAVNINTMNDNTQEIVNVLTVIGEIADQTNLLALNAAIEAARAGEQGRGFAVVADEVRALASRTQTSTEEISQILAKVQSDAANAVSAMQATQVSCELASSNTAQVSTSLATMTDAIVQINDLNNQIATAAEQQSAVTEEVSQNMNNIQVVVNDLSNSGEQTMASSRELAATNEQLAGLVGQFKV